MNAIVSTPFLGCNYIFNNTIGVCSPSMSAVNMSVDPYSGALAFNHVKNNTWEQIESFGNSVQLNLGDNEISVDNLSQPPTCGVGSAIHALLSGGPAGAPVPVLMEYNYWGNVCNNNPFAHCCGWTNGQFSFYPPAPSAPVWCNAADYYYYGVGNCGSATQMYEADSGKYDTPCDSLIQLYWMDINCGNCPKAVTDLEQALMVCDPSDSSMLMQTLELLHAVFIQCNGRDTTLLLGLAAFDNNYAQATMHPANQIPARWSKAWRLHTANISTRRSRYWIPSRRSISKRRSIPAPPTQWLRCTRT